MVPLRYDVLKEQRFCGIDKDRDDAHAIMIINQQELGGDSADVGKMCRLRQKDKQESEVL